MKDLRKRSVVHLVELAAKGLETGLELIGCIWAWDDGHSNSLHGRPDARDLRGVARAECGRPWESKASQALKGRALSRGLVTNDDYLGQGDERANIGRPEPIDLGEEGIVAKVVADSHCAVD